MNNQNVYKPSEEDCRDDSRMALYSKLGGPTRAEIEESNSKRESKKELPPMLCDNISEQRDEKGRQMTVLDVEVSMAEKAYIRYRDDLVFRMASLGKLYLLKKERLGHGNFLNWIKTRELLTHDEVNRCIKVHEVFPNGEIQITHGVRNLSQKTILEIIYAPEEVKTEVKQRLEAGETVTTKEVAALKKEHKKLLEPPKLDKKEEVKDHSPPGGGGVDDVIDGEYTVDPPTPDDEQPDEEYTELDALHDRINDLLKENQSLEAENKRLRLVVESNENLTELNNKFIELEAINAGIQSSLDGQMSTTAAMQERINWLERQLKKEKKVSNEQPAIRQADDEMPEFPPFPDWPSDLDAEDFQ